MKSPSVLGLVAIAAAATALTASAQQVGTNKAETHPSLPMQTCTASGCTDEATSIVLDANWRWVHKVGTSTNCYTGQTWDTSICSDPETCATNCALDGADYQGTYGITTSSDSVSLKLKTTDAYGTNIGSRVYLLDASGSKYKKFKLLNQEFAFDVDVSQLDCGLNGALYFVDMDEDGGVSRFSGNKAGAKYGTGYCDAQCPQDLKFISGEANILDWTPSATDKNAGTGSYGSCCAEMDIWEANSISNAYTSHPCTTTTGGSYRCESETECGAGTGNRYTGVCDKDGCDFNPYRMGNTTFFGPGADFSVDTTKPFTIVTQFVTDDGTASGTLSEIKRFYVQDGVKIETPKATFDGLDGMSSLTDATCSAAKTLFGDEDDHKAKGGLAQMGEALDRGLVLTMSLWTDHAAQCLWLDSDYPVDADASKPGVSRGTCPTSSGDPDTVVAQSPDATVTFSNIRVGEIGSTVDGVTDDEPTTTTAPATTKPATTTTAPSTTTKPAATTTAPSTTTKPVTSAPVETGSDADTDPTEGSDDDEETGSDAETDPTEGSDDDVVTISPIETPEPVDAGSDDVVTISPIETPAPADEGDDSSATPTPEATTKAPSKQCKPKRH